MVPGDKNLLPCRPINTIFIKSMPSELWIGNGLETVLIIGV